MVVSNVFDRGSEFLAEWWWLLLIVTAAFGALYWWVTSRNRPQISEIPPSLLAGRLQTVKAGHKADVRGPTGGRILQIGGTPPSFPDGPVVGIADKPGLPLADHGVGDSPPPPPVEQLHITIDLTALESESDPSEQAIDLVALEYLTPLPADPWA